MRIIVAMLIAAVAVALSGCGASEVVRAGPGTYMVSEGGGVWTQDPTGLRMDVYKKANKFCDAKGKTMKPVHVKERPYSLAHHTAAVQLTFKCE